MKEYMFALQEHYYIHKNQEYFEEVNKIYHIQKSKNKDPIQVVIGLNILNSSQKEFGMLVNLYAAISDDSEKEYVYEINPIKKCIIVSQSQSTCNIKLIEDNNLINNTISKNNIQNLWTYQKTKDLINQQPILIDGNYVEGIPMPDIGNELNMSEYSQALDKIMSSELIEELSYYIKLTNQQNIFNLNQCKKDIYFANSGDSKATVVFKMLEQLKLYMINQYSKIYKYILKKKDQ